jgi:hypothetical protein
VEKLTGPQAGDGLEDLRQRRSGVSIRLLRAINATIPRRALARISRRHAAIAGVLVRRPLGPVRTFEFGGPADTVLRSYALQAARVVVATTDGTEARWGIAATASPWR